MGLFVIIDIALSLVQVLRNMFETSEESVILDDPMFDDIHCIWYAPTTQRNV